ncbi:MAG: hypothetical protein ABR928_02860 [Terracidiphilus sp.]|jgi:hypothetical protein
MKKILVLAAMLLPMPFLLAGCSHRTVVYVQAPPPNPNFSAAAQQGYNDGVAAARRDIVHNRPPDLEHHPRFRNPPVPPPAFEEYRHGFREGYHAALHNSPPPQGPAPGN